MAVLFILLQYVKAINSMELIQSRGEIHASANFMQVTELIKYCYNNGFKYGHVTSMFLWLRVNLLF